MLTEKEKKIIRFLQGKNWTSPTIIGREVGGFSAGGQRRHSAWASPTCLRLVKKNLLERNEEGHYRRPCLSKKFHSLARELDAIMENSQ